MPVQVAESLKKARDVMLQWPVEGSEVNERLDSRGVRTELVCKIRVPSS